MRFSSGWRGWIANIICFLVTTVVISFVDKYIRRKKSADIEN